MTRKIVLIARKSTIDAAIRATQEKIERGYAHGMAFYTLPDNVRESVDTALGSMRRDVEPGVLNKLHDLKNRG